MLINPYRFATAGGGTTVYVEHDFTASTTGDLSTVNPSIDELGGGWLGDTADFDFEADSSGVQCTSVSANRTAFVQTDGREDVQVTLHFTIDFGSDNTRYQGVMIRAAGITSSEWFSVVFQGAGPDLHLRDNFPTTGNLKTWDLSVLMTTPPADLDDIELVIRCSGNDITFYSMGVNGGAHEIIDDTFTLTGAEATAHGSGSGADYYGIWSHDREASNTERFEYFKVESIP